MINLGGDESLVYSDWDRSLYDLGIRHEAEVSLFKKSDYEQYKLNPVQKW